MRLAKKKKIKKIAKQFSRVAVSWVLKSRVVLRSVRILLQPFSFFIEHWWHLTWVVGCILQLLSFQRPTKFISWDGGRKKSPMIQNYLQHKLLLPKHLHKDFFDTLQKLQIIGSRHINNNIINLKTLHRPKKNNNQATNTFWLPTSTCMKKALQNTFIE